MGMEQTTYVGPYLKIRKVNIKPIESEKQQRLFTCSNKSCNIHGKKAVGKFCSECGSQNGNDSITRKVVEVPSGYQLLCDFGNEDIDEDIDILYPLDQHDDKDIIFLPNEKNSYSIRVDSDDSFVEKEINQVPEYINAQFGRDYQKFLDFLSSKEITYQIKFGVLSYWN